MSEKDKTIDNKDINKKKRTKKSKVILYIVLIIIGVLTFTSLAVFKKHFKKISPLNSIIEAKEEAVEVENDYEVKKLIDELENNNVTLKENIDYNTRYILILEQRINELEDRLSKISIDPQKVNMIRLAISVQKNIELNKDYSSDLSTLRSLSINNKFLLERILALELYKNIIPTNEKILNDFNIEKTNFLKNNNMLVNNDSKVSKFFSNFVIIRKVSNLQENTSDDFILKLENDINDKNYSKIFETINSSDNYSKYFEKTLKNIEINIKTNNIVQDIINYLINNQR